MFKKFYALAVLAASMLFAPTAYAQFNSGSNYNTVNMSYQANSTISQNIVFDQAMQAGGTFDFSVNAHAGGGRNLQHDTGNLKLEFYNSSGTLVTSTQTSYSQNLLQANSWSTGPGDNPAPWNTISLSYTLSAADAAQTAYVKVTMIGTDASWWAGNYGPQWQMPTLTFNSGTTNILYNPEFGVAPNGVQAQGWSSSTNYSGVCGTVSGSAACVTNATGVTANMSGGGYSATGGTTTGAAGGYSSTLTSTTILATVNNGGVAPSGGGTPTVVSTAAGPSTTTSSTAAAGQTTTTTSYTYGTPVVTQTHSDASTREGGTVTVTRTTTTTTSTPYTQTVTATTPYTTTTVTTPTTITTYSDGSTTSSNGTPVTTTTNFNQDVVTTIAGTNVVSSNADESRSVNVGGTQRSYDYNVVNPFIVDVFNTPDGPWATANGSFNSTIGSSGLNFGYQKTVGNVTAGVAGRAGQIVGNNLAYSTLIGDSYSASAYVFNRTEKLWIKGAFGVHISDITSKSNIDDFDLSYQQNSEQRMVYGDIAVYSAKTYTNWRPFAGVMIVNSDIGSIREGGSSLLSNGIVASNKTYAMPYVGTRYEITENVALEGRVTQTEQYGAVTGVKLVAKKKLTDKVSINVSAGYDSGSNYDNASIMAGLVVKF